jgi:hypothetical protein
VDQELTPIPGEMGEPLSKHEAINSLADQRGMALYKNRCAHDYDAWYSDLRKSLGGSQ